jgi:hypothetical protein
LEICPNPQYYFSKRTTMFNIKNFYVFPIEYLLLISEELLQYWVISFYTGDEECLLRITSCIFKYYY